MELNYIQMIHARMVGYGVCRLVFHTGLELKYLGEVTDKGPYLYMYICTHTYTYVLYI